MLFSWYTIHYRRILFSQSNYWKILSQNYYGKYYHKIKDAEIFFFLILLSIELHGTKIRCMLWQAPTFFESLIAFGRKEEKKLTNVHIVQWWRSGSARGGHQIQVDCGKK